MVDGMQMTTTMTTKTYELPDELWREVLSYTAPCLEDRLRDGSIPYLHNIFKVVFKRRFTNIKCADIDLEYRRERMLAPLLNYHFKHDLTRILNVQGLIQSPQYDWKKLYKTGDIIYNPRDAGKRTQFAKVLRRNQKSITISYYMPDDNGEYYVNDDEPSKVYDAKNAIVVDAPWENGNVPDNVQYQVDKNKIVMKPPILERPRYSTYTRVWERKWGINWEIEGFWRN